MKLLSILLPETEFNHKDKVTSLMRRSSSVSIKQDMQAQYEKSVVQQQCDHSAAAATLHRSFGRCPSNRAHSWRLIIMRHSGGL